MAPALPPIERSALLLDLDGTLLDFAPTPDAVVVPADLPRVLRILRGRLHDAVAVVTGRPVETIEALLDDAVFAIAGEHGGAIRHTPDGAVERPQLPSPPAAWLAEAERLEATHPGTILERKARGFALHFRKAPSAGPALRDGLTALLKTSSDFEMIPARMLWEIRPRGVDKGSAVNRLMQRAPFKDRLPVFIGDDVTDRDGIAASVAMGGAGLWVPDLFGDAAGVRAWLRDVAARGDWVPPAAR
jgi:trehalose 6-phosphate phosphatase